MEIMGTNFKESSSRWLSGIEQTVSPASFRKYDGVIKAHLLPAFGTWETAAITQEEIRRFAKQKKAENLSPASLRMILFVLRKILENESGKPVVIKFRKDMDIALPTDAMQFLDRADEKRLTGSLRQDFSPDALAVILSLKMGLQQGEICALRWEDVKFAEREIRIHWTTVRTISAGEKKTLLERCASTGERRRAVPIPDSVYERLKHFPADELQGYLLTGMEKLPDPRTLQNHFRKMIQSLGLPAYPFAVLRHTFGINCVRQGMDAALIGRIMGISEKTAAHYVLKCRSSEEEQMKKFMEG